MYDHFLKIFLCLYASISYNLPSLKTIWIRVKASSYYMIIGFTPLWKTYLWRRPREPMKGEMWSCTFFALFTPTVHSSSPGKSKKCWKIQLNFYAAFTFEDNFWKYMHIIMVLVIIIFFFIFGVGAAIPSGLFVHIICISVHCSSYQLNTYGQWWTPAYFTGW